MSDDLKVRARIESEELKDGLAELRQMILALGKDTGDAFRLIHEESAASMQGLRDEVHGAVESVTGTFESLKHAAELTFAVLVGGGAFREIIEQSQEAAFEIEHLSHVFGVNAEEASVFYAAAREGQVEITQLMTATRGLVMTLNQNEGAFKNLGIQVRDSHHELLPLKDVIKNTVNGLMEYEHGTNRVAAAQQVFRRAQPGMVEDLKRWVDNLDHAREVVGAFGVEIDENGVTSARAFARETEDLKLVALGVANVLAEELRPSITGVVDELLKLAKDGTIKTWAREGAEWIAYLGEKVRDTTKWIVEHGASIKAAMEATTAWIATVLGIAAFRMVIGGLTVAWEEYTLAATASSSATMGILGFLGTIPGGLLAIGVALITYMGWWDDIAHAIEGAWGWLKRFWTDAGGGGADFDTRLKMTAASYDRMIALTEDATEKVELLRQKEEALQKIRNERTPSGTNEPSRYIARQDETPYYVSTGEGTPPIEDAAVHGGKQAPKPTSAGEQAALLQQEFEQLMSYKERELDAHKTNAQARLVIEDDYLKKVEVKFGEESDQYRKQKDAETKAAAAAKAEQNKIESIDVGATMQHRLAAINDEKVALSAAVAQGLITREQARDRAIALIDEEFEARKAALDAEAKLAVDDPVRAEELKAKYQALQDWLDANHLKVNVDFDTKSAVRTAEEVKGGFDEVAGTFTSNFQTMVNGVLQGTQTMEMAWANAWSNMGLSAIGELIKFGVTFAKMMAIRVAEYVLGTKIITDTEKLGVAERLAYNAAGYAKDVATFIGTTARKLAAVITGETVHTTAVVAGEATRTGAVATATATKEGIEEASTLKSLAMSAAEAAGKIIAAFAALPYGVGIALGIAAAAGITALILGLMGKFEKGGDVPKDMVGLLHAKEMVLPAPIAEKVRTMAATPEGKQELAGIREGAKQRGMTDVADGTVAMLHPGEMVLPATIAAVVRDSVLGVSGGASRTTTGVVAEEQDKSIPGLLARLGVKHTITAARGADLAGGPAHASHPGMTGSQSGDAHTGGGQKGGPAFTDDGGDDGGGGGKGKHHGDGDGPHKKGHGDGSGIVPSTAGAALTAGSSSGPSARTQAVHIVGSTATVRVAAASTLPTKATVSGGNVETTPAAGAPPTQVEQQGMSQVMVMNAPLRVAFNAITTMLTIFAAPFGIGMGIGIGFMSAFAKGGDVPEDMLAKLHAKEMVLPADIAEGMRGLFRSPSAPKVHVDVDPTTLNTLRGERSLREARAEPQEVHHHAATFHLGMVDTSGGDVFLQKYGRQIAKLTFDEMKRANRGPRTRR